jgi:5-methylcytosine-specific restriction enzyme B
LLFVYFLFPSSSSVGRSRKVALIREVASWKGIEIDEKSPLFDSFDNGIGDPGLAYNTGRPNELTYLARFAIAVAEKPAAERAPLLQDHVRTRKLLDDLAETHREEFGRPPQLRHILLYLLFPDDYERIASEGHKGRICEAFSEIIDGTAPSSSAVTRASWASSSATPISWVTHLSCLLDYSVPVFTDDVGSSNYPVFKGPATL